MGYAWEAFELGPHPCVFCRPHEAPHKDPHAEKMRPPLDGVSFRSLSQGILGKPSRSLERLRVRLTQASRAGRRRREGCISVQSGSVRPDGSVLTTPGLRHSSR